MAGATGSPEATAVNAIASYKPPADTYRAMPEDPPYRKNPSVADLMRKRAADEAVHAADGGPNNSKQDPAKLIPVWRT